MGTLQELTVPVERLLRARREHLPRPFQGWTHLAPFDAGDFVDAYILLPLFPIIWIVFKLIKRTKFMRADQVDLDSGRRTDLDKKGQVVDESDPEAAWPKEPWWKSITRNF